MGGPGSGKHKQHRPTQRTEPKTVRCEWCKRSMYSGRRGAQKKYCSLRCKQAAYRARHKVTA